MNYTTIFDAEINGKKHIALLSDDLSDGFYLAEDRKALFLGVFEIGEFIVDAVYEMSKGNGYVYGCSRDVFEMLEESFTFGNQVDDVWQKCREAFVDALPSID